MKLLINLCAHDGIISHYTGVGTMVKRYITAFNIILSKKHIDYKINLFTPEYHENSFGFSNDTLTFHQKMKKISIYQISNQSNGEINYGTPNYWKKLVHNTAKVINNIDCSKYDLVLTIATDTPFAGLINLLSYSQNHKQIWVPHSTGKIHEIDSAIEDSLSILNERINWEQEAINYINNKENCFVATIGKFIRQHLITNYNLLDSKCIDLINGELLSEKKNLNFSCQNRELYKKIKHFNRIVLSFGRAEEYKNLQATMYLSNELNIAGVVIAQSYYPNQPILEEYKEIAKKTNTLLYIDPPFDFARYILVHYSKKIILLVPSKKEIMGLIVNEVRKLNKSNILIVANNIDGIKEQIIDGIDGVLIDIENINKSNIKINQFMNDSTMKTINQKAKIRLKTDYNFMKNCRQFFHDIGEI